MRNEVPRLDSHEVKLPPVEWALLQRIAEDLDPDYFTWEEIEQEFNYLTRKPPVDASVGARGRLQFGRRHLEDLVATGLVYDNGDKTYSLNREQWERLLPEDNAAES